MMTKRLLVVGVGNILYGDDGIGVEVLKRISTNDSRSDVKYTDCGVCGYGLVDFLAQHKKVIIIDAVNMGAEPGVCRAFKPDDVFLKERLKPVSLHDTNVLEVINLARSAGIDPDITIIGIQPDKVAEGIGISAVLKRKIKEIEKFVRDFIIAAANKR